MNKEADGQGPLWLIDDVFALLGLILFLFSLYIIPYVFFDFTYLVPDFILGLNQWFIENYALSGLQLKMAVFLPFFLGSIVLLLISKLMTYFLESYELQKKSDAEEASLAATPTSVTPPRSLGGRSKIRRVVPNDRAKKYLLLIMLALIATVGLLLGLYLFA